jgi:hypothetical protein
MPDRRRHSALSEGSSATLLTNLAPRKKFAVRSWLIITVGSEKTTKICEEGKNRQTLLKGRIIPALDKETGQAESSPRRYRLTL